MAWKAGALYVDVIEIVNIHFQECSPKQPIGLLWFFPFFWRDTLMNKKELLSEISIFALLKVRKWGKKLAN